MKTIKSWFVLLLLITAISNAQTPPFIPASGLVGYWPFNGNANDVSGNGNNGATNNTTLVVDRFGITNRAYSFNGTNSSISIPSSTSISNFPNGQSVSLWMKISAYPIDGKEHYIFDKSDNVGAANTTFYQAFISDYTNVDNIGYRYAQSASVNSGGGTPIPFSSITTNSWIHICYTTDLTTTKTYLNGALFSTYVNFSNIGTTTNPLKFGLRNGTPPTSAPYNGILDDIGIWNRVLTADEVMGLYNAQENTCETLVINSGPLGFNPPTYASTITIYPNPAQDQITIDCGNLATVSGWTIKIVNSLGQDVFNGAMNTQQYTVNLNGWGGTGLYFVKIYNESNVLMNTKKILLQ